MKKILVFIFIFSFFFSFTLPVLADGCILIYDEDMWGLFNEEKQFCAINHKDGIQNMILTVDTGQELTGEKAVWIFPVPAKPEETGINIMQGFPQLNGYDIEDRAKSSLNGIFTSMRLTQLYTMPYYIMNFVIGTTGSLLEGLTVHNSIEKMGLVTELVSARDSSSMSKYISSKGLDFPKASQSLIDEYIGKDYSFVISWISNVEAFKKSQNKTKKEWGGWTGNAIGVFVTFPTEKLYYPLKLTSVYGDKEVPTVIYALDHVTPELYNEIKPYTKTEYYFDNRVLASEELNDFFTGYKKEPYTSFSQNNTKKEFAINNVKYTKIELNPPSKYLNQDLWMDNSAPARIAIAHSINKFESIIFFLFFILCSCLASLLSGLVTFQKGQISKKKLTLLGLWNFLTLIGFSIAASKNNALKAVEIRTQHKNNFLFLKIIILSSLVFVGSCLFILFTSKENLGDPREVARMYVISTMFAIPSIFLVWGFYSNNKIRKFTILFTFFFIILTFIAPKLINIFI